MITGTAELERARVAVTFLNHNGLGPILEFVVDTGFEGALLLPMREIRALGLERITDTTTQLADNTSVDADVYGATIVWDGLAADVAVIAMGERPLLGTALLANRRLTVDFIPGGKVSIETLPPG